MKIKELLGEVSMKPGVLKGFLDSSFAQSVTIGFEFELIVPGLEDITNYHSDPENREASPEFPTSEDWKEKAFKWLTDGPTHSSNSQVQLCIDSFEKDYDDWVNVKFRKYADSNKGKEAIKTEIAKVHNTDDADIIKNDILSKNKFYRKAIDNVKSEYIESSAKFNIYTKENLINNFDDFCYMYSLKYPHGYVSTLSLKQLANNFKLDTNFNVIYSKVYHGRVRRPGQWIFEPDASVADPTRKGTGIELVSPPMPLHEGLEALNAVWSWTNKNNITTNENTGMHVGVSIPNHEFSKIDYIKLILFLGDNYILQEFSRQNNAYTQSMFNKMNSKLHNMMDVNKTKFINNFLTTIKMGINNLARASFIRNLTKTSIRYVTVNIKDNYIEFRSAGGDYLNQKEKILATIARYIRVLSIAADPEAEKEEYTKKLYKFVSTIMPNKEDPVGKFIKYAAGNITLNQLKILMKQTDINHIRQTANDRITQRRQQIRRLQRQT